MKLLSYLGFSAICLALLYGASFLVEPEETVIGHEAADPDLFLGNSKVYAVEHAYDRSLMHLREAINAIREIEQELDEESQETVEEAVGRLEKIHDELANDSLNMEDMNKAFINVLNALTFAEIKVSEHFLESHEQDKAELALKYGKLHIKNAIKYATGETRKYEVRLYKEIDSVVQSKELSNEEIIAHLEHMLAELDTLVE